MHATRGTRADIPNLAPPWPARWRPERGAVAASVICLRWVDAKIFIDLRSFSYEKDRLRYFT
jgi:hypothetical protein